MHEPGIRYKKITHSLYQISYKILKEVNETKQVMNTEHVVEQQIMQKLFLKKERWKDG